MLEVLQSGQKPCQYKNEKFWKKHRIYDGESVTIMPCSSATPESIRVTKRSIATHKNTCDSHLIAFDNTSPCMGNRMDLRKFVEARGYTYRYIRWPFSLTALYNLGTIVTNSKFINHSTADVTYHPEWLDEIKYVHKHFGEDYQSYHPYSKPTKGLKGDNWRYKRRPGEITTTTTPLCHVNVFHRPKAYYWDEALPWWESDIDYWIWCHYHKRRIGLCLGARVDTQVRGIMHEAQKDVDLTHLNTMIAWVHMRIKWGGFHTFQSEDMKVIFGE